MVRDNLAYGSNFGKVCSMAMYLMLAGAAQPSATWQRISVMHVLRQLCEDPQLLNFLFVTYDMRWEVHLNAVQALVKCLASIVESYIRGVPDAVDEDLHLAGLASAFQHSRSNSHGADSAPHQDGYRGLISVLMS